MRLLAIETATEEVAVALGTEERALAAIQVSEGRRHGEALAPAIEAVCRLARVGLAELDGVAVDLGPGLFTGLRVGVATAQALCSALGLPAVGVSSLDALAHPHRHRPGAVAAVVDARRGEVFWALYRGGVAAGEPSVAAPEQVASALGATGEDVLAVGDGAARYAELLEKAGAAVEPAQRHPSATVVLELGASALAAGSPVAPEALLPRYLRQPDVRVGWQERQGRVARGG